MPKHKQKKVKTVVLKFDCFFQKTKKWDNEKLFTLRKMLEKDESLVEKVLQFKFENVTVTGPPLFSAVLVHKSNDLIKVLLSHGADINARCVPSADTVLHYAVLNIHDTTDVRLIEFLITYGANINAKNMLNDTPLHKLMSCWKNKYPHQLDVLRILLFNGVLVNEDNARGYSALYYACILPTINLDATRMLLNSGAHCDLQKAYNILKPFNRNESLQCNPCRVSTGVYCSCNYRQIQTVKLLLSYKIICSPRLQRSSADTTSFLVPDASTIVDFSFCKTILEDIVWGNYCNAIIHEICQMSVDRCTQHCTLLEFVQQSVTTNPVKASTKLVDEVSFRLSKNKYPNCRDILFAAINRKDLIEQELLMSLYVTDKKKCIVLNSNCVSALKKYLSKEDILNLLLCSDKFEKHQA